MGLTFTPGWDARSAALRPFAAPGMWSAIDADHWQVPDNLVERGASYDASRGGLASRFAYFRPSI